MTSRLRVEALRIHGVGPIDLDVDRGECLGLSGPSGSGKTLLLRAIADMEPHEGAIFLDGSEQATIAAPAWRRQVGLLPAESLWWFDTVGDHFSRPDSSAVHRLGLDDAILDWPVSRLSSGERQRLAILRLLENQPRLLLLDEPTANLDEENALRAESILLEYRETTAASIVWVGHQKEQLLRVADRRFALSDGKLAQIGGAS